MSIFYLFSFVPLVIPIIILVFIYISLNNKISKLKERVDSLTVGAVMNSVPNTVQTSSTTQTVTPMQTQTASVAQSTPAFQPVTVSSIAQNIQTPKPEVSGEEKGGKFLGKIGVVAILLAGAFFLKDVPDEGKIMIGIIVGIVFIGLGFYLRAKYRTYAHVLMGGGIAVLYLTIFGATTVFKMIDSNMGFALMILITIVSVVISLVEDSIELSVLSAVGGFLTPIVISTGSNNYFGLFTYLLVLDLGILVISFRKKWSALYHVGFWGTGIVFFVWLSSYYKEDLLSPVMIFLTLYFVVFLFASVFHHLIRKEKSIPSDVFGISLNALLYFATSISILYDKYQDNLGYFALVMAIIYAMLAYASYNTMKEDKILNYLLTGIAVIFLSITIPLQFSGSWITTAWLIEALVLYFMAFYIPHEALKKFGMIVFALGVFRVLFYEGIFWSVGNTGMVINAFMNIGFIMLVMAVVISYVIQYLYSKFESKESSDIKSAIIIFILIANVLTVAGITSQIYLFYENNINAISLDYRVKSNEFDSYRGNSAYSEDMQNQLNIDSQSMYEKTDSLRNQRNTMISVFWAVYAVLLIAIGFIKKIKFLRILGLLFFVVTAIKIFFDIWSLGTQYRVISLVAFGVVALLGSFGYAKYKDKIIN